MRPPEEKDAFHGSILGFVPSKWEVLQQGCWSVWSMTFTRPFGGLVLRSVPFLCICKGFRIGSTRTGLMRGLKVAQFILWSTMTSTFPFHLLIGFTTLQRRRSEMAESSKYNLTQFFLSASRQSLHNIFKQTENELFCWGRSVIIGTHLCAKTCKNWFNRTHCLFLLGEDERDHLLPNIPRLWARTIIWMSSWILT